MKRFKTEKIDENGKASTVYMGYREIWKASAVGDRILVTGFYWYVIKIGYTTRKKYKSTSW